MPKKLNKAGQQQEYVPSGNGDASGEYADDGGSNRHFTAFKKPDTGSDTTSNDGQKVVKGKPQTFIKFKKDQNNSNEESIKQAREKATQILSGTCSKLNEQHKNTFKKVIDETNDEGVAILSDYIKANDKLNINFGNAGRNAAGYASGNTIVTNGEVHTIRHEIGHTFDTFIGKDFAKNNKAIWDGKGYASVEFIDEESGKTMNEMIHEELGIAMYKGTLKGWRIAYVKQGRDSYEKKKEAFERINVAFQKYGNKLYDEETGITNARERYKLLRNQDNDARNKYLWGNEAIKGTDLEKEYNEANKAKWDAESAYARDIYSKGGYSVTYNDSPEVVNARKIYDEVRQKVDEEKRKAYENAFPKKLQDELNTLLHAEYMVSKKMEGIRGIVGDTQDYLNVGASTFFTLRGHGKHYFDQRKEGGYVIEIFANMFDSYTDKESWKKDCIREMFPKTSKIFEKIYAMKGHN